jgi:hypothetical protein
MVNILVLLDPFLFASFLAIFLQILLIAGFVAVATPKSSKKYLAPFKTKDHRTKSF